MNVMGMTFNRPNFAGAAANQKQQNNMLAQISAFKKKNPNPPAPPAAGLAQIPAFKAKASEFENDA